ncbi:MAG: hypothetical protein H6563_07305 [Lewinellaceae bacterium]|nr:hypothetical protein [Lewinellaceae bacterium]
MKKLSFVLTLAFAVTILLPSCQKDSLIDPNDPYAGKAAPQLPQPKTFVMPMDKNFEEFANNDPEQRTITNWGHSAANILVWNTILTANLAVPVLAFYESFNHQAVYQGFGVWLWEYSVSDNSGTYHAKLYGELLASDEVKWDMYVSKDGGFQDVNWYTGIVAWDQSYAHWTLNYNALNPAPFIQADYQADNGSGVASIRYTNIIPGNVGNGGYIEYREGAYNGGEFDRAYDVFKIELDNLLEINWNSLDHHGRVKDMEKFGDDLWHCWDTNLQDTQC